MKLGILNGFVEMFRFHVWTAGVLFSILLAKERERENPPPHTHTKHKKTRIAHCNMFLHCI